jgi:hypothetical protein
MGSHTKTGRLAVGRNVISTLITVFKQLSIVSQTPLQPITHETFNTSIMFLNIIHRLIFI